MNKRTLTVAIVSFLFLVIGLAIYYYFNLPPEVNVKFTSTYPDTKLQIKSESGKKTAVASNQTVKLSVGDYSATYTNKDLDQNLFYFSISKGTSKINLDPNLNGTILASKMATEKGQIEQTVVSLFTSNNYSMDTENLYHRGEWFAGSLVVYQPDPFSSEDSGNPDSFDRYYIVMKKVADKWELVAGPKLILTKPENPTIPDYILKDINPSK